MEFKHIPVLYEEIMTLMDAEPDDIVVDCTLGGGGHSKGFLMHMQGRGTLIGIDQDPDALKASQNNLAQYNEQVIYVHSNYRYLGDILDHYAPLGVDKILFDLGVSSYQLDEKERGFSYMQDAPLDMRMNPAEPFSAYDVVNSYTEEALHRIIKEYGEENWAKRIAQFIVQIRQQSPIRTTGELVEIIKKAVPKGARIEGSHPAKRTFQAIRIEVNHELDVLKITLDEAVKRLKKGGRLGIISFHSLEDRIVKERFKYWASDCICPPEMPFCQCDKISEVKILTKKPLVASPTEAAENSRSKSAKFRAVEKII